MSRSFTADVGETQTLIFDFTQDLAKPWYSEFEFALTEFITVGSFVYECTNAGKTAAEEPTEWPQTIGQTVEDGSVQWTCRDFGAGGSDSISAKTVTPGSGLTVDSSAIVKSTRVDVTFTVGAIGTHDLLCKVETAAGQTHKRTLIVCAE